MATRRFPRPWTIEGNPNCFWVVDAEGKRFGYTYFCSGQESIGTACTRELTRDEALLVVRNIARLPELLQPAVERRDRPG